MGIFLILGDFTENDISEGLELYQEALEHERFLGDESLLCECHTVSKKDLLNFAQSISRDELNPELIAKKLKVGTGCGQCHSAMLSWLKNYMEYEE